MIPYPVYYTILSSYHLSFFQLNYVLLFFKMSFYLSIILLWDLYKYSRCSSDSIIKYMVNIIYFYVNVIYSLKSYLLVCSGSPSILAGGVLILLRAVMAVPSIFLRRRWGSWISLAFSAIAARGLMQFTLFLCFVVFISIK